MSSSDNRRAPVQGEGPYYLRDGDPRKVGSHPPGTIAWVEHLEVWAAYARRYGTDQSAERIAERGGFGFFEAAELLGRELKTWLPR